MKKLLLAIGLLVFFIVIDVAVRMIWDEEPTPSLNQPVDGVDQGSAAVADEENERTTELELKTFPERNSADDSSTVLPLMKKKPSGKKNKGKSNEEPDLPLHMKPLEVQRICGQVTRAIASKSFEELNESDLGELRAFSENTGIPEVVQSYFFCKAIEAESTKPCERSRELIGRSLNPSGCYEGVKIALPVKWYFYKKLEPDRFQVRVLEFSPGIQKTMKGYWEAMTDQNPNACLKVTTNPTSLAICRAASGQFKSPPKEPELRDLYYMVEILKTQKKKHLSDIGELYRKTLVRVLLEEPRACEEYINEALSEQCEAL